MKAFCMLLALLSLPLTPRRVDANPAKAGDLQARRDKLQKIIDEEWEFQLRAHPVQATVFGDYRYNDKIDDLSPAEQGRIAKELRAFQIRLQSIDTTGFTEQEQLNKSLLMRQNSDGLQEFELKDYEMPLDQFNGVHLAFAELPSVVPLDSTKHYEDYLARLHAIPFALQQAVEDAQLGEKDHLMPPKFLLEQVVTQCDSIAAPAGKDNAFAVPLASFPKDMPQADQDRLRKAILDAIDTEVRPAYQRLSQFVKDVYAPKGRTEPGIWALPDGDTRYQFAIHEMTTTDMTPQQVFDLGMQQVHEDEAQMDVLARRQGYSDWKAYDAAIRNDPKMHASSREQVLDTYRHFIAQMQPKLPELFGILPKARLEVVPTEAYREKESAGADYQVGTPDGSRPGQVHVNTYDFEHRLLPEMEDTAYHEGIPGHHMQLSIAQELPALPAFRQHASYTAYVEGWALYSERLGKEIGFYTDPADDFERLGDDLLRATRLVEDSGVHYKHWTRDDMVKFFHENSIESEASIQAETDRYIAWPGQALGYKIGQLKFLELRKRAKDALGGKFDIRAFHDEMLDGGAMPLDVLDTRTNAWIESVRAGAVSGD
jgi:uncharacterized protein (DUF885 family)